MPTEKAGGNYSAGLSLFKGFLSALREGEVHILFFELGLYFIQDLTQYVEVLTAEFLKPC